MQAGIALGNIATVLSLPSEETGIVSELKAGSEEAFAWLIAKYHQPIYSLLARTIPDPADAADLTQDVFIKIYRGIGSFNGDSSLRTWIYRIALREASTNARKSPSNPNSASPTTATPSASKTPSSTLMNHPLTALPRKRCVPG
jgi:RNA polymerase sigma-70 factor (ECF subfamily)